MNETNHLGIQANLLDHVAKIEDGQRDDSDDVVRPFQAQWNGNRTRGRILKCLVKRGHDLLLIKSVPVELNYRTVGEMEESRQQLKTPSDSRNPVDNGFMDVSVLHIDDCPSWVETSSRLAAALGNVGIPDTKVRFVVLRTREDALRVPFSGSPTILVDGEDLFPSSGRTTDLACRIYFSERHLAGLPSLEDIETALRQRLLGG